MLQPEPARTYVPAASRTPHTELQPGKFKTINQKQILKTKQAKAKK